MRLGRAIFVVLGLSGLPILIYFSLLGRHALTSFRGESLIAFVLALILLIAFPFAYGLAKNGKIDVFDPASIVSLCFLLGYVLPIPAFLNGQDVMSKFLGLRFSDFHGSLRIALTGAVLGLACFHLGYFALTRKSPAPLILEKKDREGILRWSRPRLFGLGVAFTIAGLGLFGIGVYLLGGLSALFKGIGDRIIAFAGLNYFIQALLLLLVVSLMWWSHLLITGKLKNAWFWVYTILAISLTSLTGNKSTILVFFLAATLMYHLLRREIRPLRAVLGGIGVFSLIVAIGLFTREYLVVGYFPTLDPRDISGSLQFWLERELGGNFMQIQILTVLADRVPVQLPYQWGLTYLSLLTMPIPRALWAGKLTTSPGVFTMAAWPALWLTQDTTIPPGLVGEMYMNFGFPGIALGMLLFGYVLARIKASIGRFNQRTAWVLFYVLIVGMIPHYIRGDFEDGTTALAMLSLPMMTAVWFGRLRGPRIAAVEVPRRRLEQEEIMT